MDWAHTQKTGKQYHPTGFDMEPPGQKCLSKCRLWPMSTFGRTVCQYLLGIVVRLDDDDDDNHRQNHLITHRKQLVTSEVAIFSSVSDSVH